MRSAQEMQINGLLLQREELFVRIHELERAISLTLGEPYPFVRPPLPSDHRVKRKPATTKPAPRDPVRPLEAAERAYRITYLHFGKTAEEDHDQPGAIRTFLASQSESLSVTRLETIDAAGRTKHVLFQK